MLLFYIRHGDPVYEPDQLTPLGRRQAEAVAKRLALYGIDKVYASTSIRARLTAQPTCEILKKEPTLLDFANEMHAWNELAMVNEQNQRRWCFDNPRISRLFATKSVKDLTDRWYEHPELKQYDFGRGISRINRDTDAWLATLGYEHDRENGCYRITKPSNDRVALFAHKGFGLAFLSSVLDVPYPQIATHFDMSHTGMTVIRFPNGDDGITVPKAMTVANDSHIYREGLPTKYNNYLYF